MWGGGGGLLKPQIDNGGLELQLFSSSVSAITMYRMGCTIPLRFGLKNMEEYTLAFNMSLREEPH